MIAVQILLIAIGALLADAHECKCDCDGNDVCHEQTALRTELDENKAEVTKLNKHYDFMRSFAKVWHNQVSQVVTQQLVGINETIEGIKNDFKASQRDVSIEMGKQKARIESLENSLRTLIERADKLDANMQNISEEMSAIKTESGGNQRWGECGVVDYDGGRHQSVWPWMAAVYKNGNELLCFGTVIDRYFVLTPARCLYGRSSDGISVKLGLSDLKDGRHHREYRVMRIHTHPRYDRYSNYDYDIALLEVEHRIQFGTYVSPVCLPPRERHHDEPFYRAQSSAKAIFLDSYVKSPYSASPTTVDLTVFRQEDCRRKIRELNWERQFPASPDHTFCTESYTSPCPDWGSPILQYRRTRDGERTWTQVGIQIWNKDCRYFFSPRLDNARGWIDDKIWDSSHRQANPTNQTENVRHQ